MNCDKWEDVLIQWINCLKLCDPINDLESLRNGEFFLKLLHILDPAHAPITYDDCLATSIDLIKSQYPNYTFDEEYLSDLQSLSTKHWMPVGDSPLVGKSPLQEFLRSPNAKSTRFEKDRQIKKLKSELEMERFEKGDLQEELREHKEHITKLANQIKDKTAQISKLRNELYTLENRTPPHNKKTSSSDIERQLKMDIQNLEQYVEQLQTKHDDIQEENINISEKLRNSTKELKVWKLTAESLELNNKELLEKYSKQEIELENLRAQCSELSAFLDEIRSNNKGNDSSAFFSPLKSKRRSMNDNGVSFDDLAHTIVDIQLKDSQRENNELRSLLKESSDRGSDLQAELDETKKNYEEVSRSFIVLEEKNNDLLQRVTELTTVYEELKHLHLQTEEEMMQLSKFNTEKDSEILSLKSELQKSGFLCGEYIALNTNISSELQQLKVDLEETQHALANKSDLYENLQKEAVCLETKYEESVEKFNRTNFGLEALKEKYTQFTQDTENSLRKLESIACGCNIIEYNDKFLENLILKIEDNRYQTNKEIGTLKQNLVNYENLISVLNREVAVLKEEEKINSEKRENLSKLLNAAEISQKNLQEIIDKQNLEIKNKTNKIIELNSTIGELSKLEEVVAAKNSRIADLETAVTDKEMEINQYIKEEANLKENVQKLEGFQASLQEQLNHKTGSILSLQSTNSSLNQTLLDMEFKVEGLSSSHAQKIMEQEKLYLEKIHVSNLQIQESLVKIEEIENELKLTKENLDLKSTQLLELHTIMDTVKENNLKVTEDLARKINLTENTIKKLEIELSIVKNERDNLQSDVDNLNSDRERITSEKEILAKNSEDLKAQLQSNLEKLSNVEEACAQKDTVISQNSKELLHLKLDLETKKQEYKNLQGNIEKLNIEATSYKFCIETLEARNSDYENKITKLEKELDVLNNLKESLENKNLELTKHMSDILSKLTAKDEELSKAIRNLCDQKEDFEIELKRIHGMYEQANKNIQNLENERLNIIDKNNNEVSILREEINRLNNKIYELNAKEVDYVHELQVIKSELNVAFEKYTHSFDEQQEMKSEYEAQIKNLTENLHEVVTKYNQLEKNHHYNLDQLKNTSKSIEKLKEEKVALEVEIVDQKKKYDQEFEETNEQFNVDFKQLKKKHAQLEQALFKAKSDLEQQIGIQFRLENDVKKLIVKVGDVEVEKSELLQKMESLENIKCKLENDYKSLKLRHEEYILANESTLKECENQFQNEINSVQSEKQHLQEEIATLLKSVEYLTTENEKHQKEIRDNQEQHQKITNDLQGKIQYYESTNTRIIEEQVNLNEKVLRYQNQIEGNQKIAAEQSDTISKLKSAYDILQTAKEEVEADLKIVQEHLKSVESDYLAKEIESSANLQQNQEKLGKLTEELEAYKQLSDKKERELSGLNNQLIDLHRVNEAMKSQMELLEEELKKSTENHEIIFNKIEEENLHSLSEMSNQFSELKSKYEEVSEEITVLRNERKEIKENLKNSSSNMCDLQKTIESNEITIQEFRSKIQEIDAIRIEKEIFIKELGEELADKVNKLTLVENEKLKLAVDLEEARMEIEHLKKSRDDILESQHKIIKETEDNLLRAHANAIDVKNDLLMNVENAKEEVNLERNEKLKLQRLLEEEKAAVKFLEIELLDIQNQKSKFEQLFLLLKKCLKRLSEVMNEKSGYLEDLNEIDDEKLQKVTTELEKNIVETYRRSRELETIVLKLQNYESELHKKLEELEKEKVLLNEEKNELLVVYNNAIEKNKLLLQQQSEDKTEMQKEITGWMQKCEENSPKIDNFDVIKTENEVLHQTIISLKDKNVKAYNVYNEFAETSRSFKTKIDKILKDRNSLDISITELRQLLIHIQMKCVQLNRDFSTKHQEQKETFEYIVEDIQKQFNRYSKIAYNLAYNNIQVSEKVMQGILQEKYVAWQPLMKELNIDEVSDKLEELQDRTTDAVEQLKSFEEVLDKPDVKNPKILKENILRTTSSSQLSELKKDDELRKKCNALRQKLTLTENVKNNYEKKVKQLREENRKLLAAGSNNLDEDASYKLLLQQHIQSKEEFEKKLSELKTKYQRLQAEYVELKKQQVKTEDDGLADKSERDVQALREAYGKLMSENSKLELDNTTLRNVLKDKDGELLELSLVREAYEKLLEENSKMMTEVDTLKYKRSRDKEEYLHLLKKEREDREGRESKKIQQIRAEYESKLESMKSKMLCLYKEELDKESRKLAVEKSNYDLLKFELEESKRTIEQLRMSQKFDLLGSHESLSGLSVKSECDARDMKNIRGRGVMDPRRGHSGNTLKSGAHDRRYATLPRCMGIIEEDRRSSINAVPPDLGQNLEMEDEGELFNNKYLADLKEGHCVVGTSGDSRSSRVSELVWRNSMCPPHLKSSYPAELQFTSPTRFKEEDIKTGNIDFDDSMSTKLLPGEKSRKKDIGTTSYKKPGPPTPSKNGGRLSLQSNEIQPPKDVQDSDAKTPKRTTPSRIRNLFFRGRNSNTKSSTEAQASTPKPKGGTRIFRKVR
ncbi:hypothetical protein Trydic_g3173 [Trypoxylus dichotomus]